MQNFEELELGATQLSGFFEIVEKSEKKGFVSNTFQKLPLETGLKPIGIYGYK